MSFPCSLFNLLSKNLKTIGKYNIFYCIYVCGIRGNIDKYLLKKLTRQAQKTMQAVGNSNLLSPPESIRGIKIFDKSLFQKTIDVPAVFLEDVVISSIMPHLKKYILKMENLKPLQIKIEGNETVKYLLLNPVYVQTWTDISEKDRESLNSLGITKEQLKPIKFTISYENWKADELLRFIIPQDKDSVAGFSKIGHIAHVNLRDHTLKYKNIIGQILLDKISGCRTVVNKLDKIDNTYRFFQMEVLCGENDMNVVTKENRCSFAFDFSTVYWNPRLATEHERIVQLLEEGDILYDIFAGVGPFAIPAAKKRITVLANDLNPESFKWMNHNAKINKVKDEYLKTFNKDGKDFILNEVKVDLEKRLKNNDYKSIYISMNLPALAPEFLPHFKGLLNNSDIKNVEKIKLPKVFVYCFAKGENPVEIARDLVEKNLGCPLPDNSEIFNVRKVSNFKEMMRVSFEFSREFLFDNACKKRSSDERLAENTKKCNCYINFNVKTSLNDIFVVCHGKEQRETNEEHIQGGRGEKLKAENKSQSC